MFLLYFFSSPKDEELTYRSLLLCNVFKLHFKQYVAIISMSTLSSDEPNELFLESIVRAKTMENISSKDKFKKVKEMAFMTSVLFELLKLAKFYEKPDHEHIKDILVKYNIDESFHFDCYKKALKWCMTYAA